jgi:DNA polymerase-3 subunit alpha
MAFATLEDMTGTIELVVFPNTYNENSAKLSSGKVLVVSGEVSFKEDETPKIICNKIYTIDEYQPKSREEIGDKIIYLKFKNQKDEKINKIISLLENNKGQTDVFGFFEEHQKVIKIPRISKINAKFEIIEEIKSILGENGIVFKNK